MGPSRHITRCLWLLVWLACLWIASPARGATRDLGKKQPPKSSRWPMALTLAPQLGLSDAENVPIGGGASLQFIASPLERFGVGVEAAWSRHGNIDFLRAALLLQILIDDLAIHPFLQTGVGLQLRLDSGEIKLSPDLHLGLGFDVPVLTWLTVGASFQVIFPIDATTFPITKTLHLRIRLLF